MKPHELIRAWRGDKRFTAIAKRAGELKKQGHDATALVAAITSEFGAPAAPTPLRDAPQPHTIFGDVGAGADIEQSALDQLRMALRLPVAVGGALMPDAHVGYALPIGGVFVAHRAVSPMMVGVDIGCRMHLTILDIPPDELRARRAELLKDLGEVTVFGVGGARQRATDHELLDDDRWQATPRLRHLLVKAKEQIGTSGGGNHFAELLEGELLPAANGSALPATPQRFAALLTHSGSRGVGFAIANGYSKIAAEETARHADVPKMYEWLDIGGAAGQEYWHAMELAGDFARANHEVIHAAFLRRTRLGTLGVVQNHHNFAWRDGDNVIHRKGATPAGAGELGIIPGSMATSTYIVAGQGNPASYASAAHGAGRRFSRTHARNTIAQKTVQDLLRERDVLVRGLSVDESPLAYKDIERVIDVQVAAGLITPVARLRPLAVIMAGEPGED